VDISTGLQLRLQGVEMAGRVLSEPLHTWLGSGAGAVWMGSEM
jgi:hypothetical protein